MLADRPKRPVKNASHHTLSQHIVALNTLLDRCEGQMSADYAQMVLMHDENGSLRQQLFEVDGA
jgi:hypothetical protein